MIVTGQASTHRHTSVAVRAVSVFFNIHAHVQA